MEKEKIVTTVKGKLMKEYKKEYWENYKKKNKRVVLTVSNEKYLELKKEAKKQKKSISEYARLKVDSDFYNQPSPEIKDQLREISFLLRNATNNINQIAHNLNLEALETGHVDIKHSEVILQNIYAGIEKLETIITSYAKGACNDSQIKK